MNRIKQMILNFIACSFLLLLSSANAEQETNSSKTVHLKRVLTIPHLRVEIGKFIDNILQQLPAKDFFALVDSLRHFDQLKTDKQVYHRILHKVGTIKPRVQLYYQIKALQNQKQVLSDQAHKILGNKKVNNCVEIGTPGTYIDSMKSFLTRTGSFYVINDKEHWGDQLQAFGLNPINKFLSYDHFITLDNYKPIGEKDIPNNSVDLVVCFIGLHHIPIEKLDDFVSSIRRILRPGGTFLLRDHNVINGDVESLVWAAHSIYNAIMTGESVVTETAEYRNFHDLQYWVALLEKHGFSAGSERLLQEGDPTLNTMLKFTKVAQLAEEQEAQLAQDIKDQQPDYERDITQTYLSAPEWLNVDVSQEYGEFVEHTPFYEFPYFSSIGSYWDVFGKSWQAARKKKSDFAVATSSYTLMNLFVGASMTLEYTAKGLVSLPMRWAYSGAETETIKLLIRDRHNELGQFATIKVIQNYPDGYALVEMPRYKEFLKTVNLIINTAIELCEIAGQKEIQIKVRAKSGIDDNLLSVDGCHKEYDWQIPTKPGYAYAALTVQISKLKNILRHLKSHDIEILHIHDF